MGRLFVRRQRPSRTDMPPCRLQSNVSWHLACRTTRAPYFSFEYRSSRRDVNARSTQRHIGRRGSMEVWRRMYFDDSDLYYRVLVTRLRALLVHKFLPTDNQLFCCLPDRKI